MKPADILRDFLLDNYDDMTLDLIARVINGVYDQAELNILIDRLRATQGAGYKQGEE